MGGLPLHKCKEKLSIERDKIILKGENTDSNISASFQFSLKEVENTFLGWDETLLRWKDNRVLIHPLNIIFKVENETRKLVCKETRCRDLREENECILEIL